MGGGAVFMEHPVYKFDNSMNDFMGWFVCCAFQSLNGSIVSTEMIDSSFDR